MYMLIVITIKLDYSKVPSKSTVPTYAYQFHQHKFHHNVNTEFHKLLLAVALVQLDLLS